MGSLVDALETTFGRGDLGMGRGDVLARGVGEAINMAGKIPQNEYTRDAWKFVTNCVWTLDEADANEPIKQFPAGVCRPCRRYLPLWELVQGCRKCKEKGKPLDYLQIITDLWIAKDPPVLMVPKPRRMRLSWLLVALHAWMAVTQRGAAIYFQSSKEEKSAELVDRVGHILEYVPRGVMAIPQWRMRSKPPHIEIPSLSGKIVGVAEGPDQLRQFTARAIMMDEIGTWTWPRASYAASKPCIEGGGQIVLVSSAYPGFWHNAVAGELSL